MRDPDLKSPLKAVTSRTRTVLAAGSLLLLVPHLLFLLQPFFFDEQPILNNVQKFFFQSTLIPYDAKYPTLYSYLVSLPIAAGAVVQQHAGVAETLIDTFVFLNFMDPRGLAIPARIVSLLFLATAATALSRFCWSRFGKLPALFVFATVMASPAFLSYGSWALPDAAVFLFSTLSLLAVLLFLETFGSRDGLRLLLLSAALSGLAIAVKYNAASATIPVGFSILYLFLDKQIGLSRAAVWILAAAAACVAAFLLGTPGWLIDPTFYYAELMFIVRQVEAGHLGATGVPGLGNLELLLIGAPVIFVTGILGFIAWINSKERIGWPALVCVVSGLLLAAMSAKQSLHYMFPVFPGLLIFSAIFWRTLARRSNVIATVTAAVILALPLYNAWNKGLNYLDDNTTVLTRQWMYDNIDAGSRVAKDWAYVPNVYSSSYIEQLRAQGVGTVADALLDENRLYDVTRFAPHPDWLTSTDAEYFVTSSHVYDRFFEFGTFTRLEPLPGSRIAREFAVRKRFYTALFSSPLWEEVFVADTGNGPVTRIFRRRPADADSAAAPSG